MSSPEDPDAITHAEALHDVSNALTVIVGWLAEATENPAARDHALAVASSKARQAQALARRAIGGASSREPSRAIGDVVQEVIDALAIELVRAGLTVEVRGEELTDRVAEPSAVAHALTNLALNALAFSPRGTTLHVHVRVDEAGRACVTVADEGPGIAAEIAPRLFEGASGRRGGAGIGLGHARREARRLGGELALVPSSRGATFALTLPIDRAVDLSASSEGGEADGPTSLRTRVLVEGVRVLVIEDDRAVCALLDAGLGARGAEVVALHDGSALAQTLPPLGHFDAVLLDLSPIAHDVRGALAAVHAALPHAGIVFISGSAVGVPADLSQSAPGVRWVRKPFDIGEVTRAIAELVAARR